MEYKKEIEELKKNGEIFDPEMVCGYCGENVEGYGNSSHFVKGKICDNCNFSIEIPARLKRI